MWCQPSLLLLQCLRGHQHLRNPLWRLHAWSGNLRVRLRRLPLGKLSIDTHLDSMHYMGNGGISNFKPSYSWPYVLGSAIIAIAASTIALRVFFHFRARWTNSWFKRASCASLLYVMQPSICNSPRSHSSNFSAMAVSGMHWVATIGTQYRLAAAPDRNGSGLSRQATAVVVICLVCKCRPILRRLAEADQP